MVFAERASRKRARHWASSKLVPGGGCGFAPPIHPGGQVSARPSQAPVVLNPARKRMHALNSFSSRRVGVGKSRRTATCRRRDRARIRPAMVCALNCRSWRPYRPAEQRRSRRQGLRNAAGWLPAVSVPVPNPPCGCCFLRQGAKHQVGIVPARNRQLALLNHRAADDDPRTMIAQGCVGVQ